jgi:predicted peptidase
VDPDRIYVTGLSSGGIGAWDAMGKYPHKFAAAVPISAGCDPLVLRVKQGVSVWAFYNEGDELF